ncbi:MAG: hypothetical protein Q8P15_01180 [Nanoarchaeota archaeon]|nr:hypothetical protein [Nanoarchaeota archaeon]
MGKKILILAIGMFLIFSSFVFLIQNVSAASLYCCEKTLSGAWCQNAPKDQCDTDNGLNVAATSCDATSFCKLGTCIDNQGACKINTAQTTCRQNGGYWAEGKPENIPQCQKGCCLVEGQGPSFIEQARCTSYSSLYGAQIEFRGDIKNSELCSASATSNVKGACVLEEELGKRNCKFLTQRECVNAKGSFNENVLCTATWLNTSCVKTKETTCFDEKVYFKDNCGNLANIYDASKYDDQDYWNIVIAPENSCGFDDLSGNANSPSCGNCDYHSGSACKMAVRGQDATPTIGNNICRDLSCKYEGETYQQGEKWCVTNTENSNLQNNPGGESWVLECRDGEVLPELCGDGPGARDKICVQEELSNGFKSANCVANNWQECVFQDNEEDCLIEELDCKWIKDYSFGEYNPNNEGVCVPRYSPGFTFWNPEEKTRDICSQGTVTCSVTYEKGLGGKWEAKTNAECDPSNQNYQSWLNKMEGVCVALGDCGSSVNYRGQKGFNELKATKV